jgi:hypothetical protein
MLKRVLILALVCIPAAAWAMMHPAWVVESISGVTCIDETICADDPSRFAEAAELYDGALKYLSSSITPLLERPLVVFCASERCYRRFGFNRSSAESVGRFCIVIGPRGWKPFYVRHEMIHRLQVQEMGIVRMYLEPRWFIEGMAYELSGDPRTDLAEPFQQYRAQFRTWYAETGREHLWQPARMP